MASVSIAVCNTVLPSNGSSSGHKSSEVIVVNNTASEVDVAVRVVDNEDNTLFSRVFSTGPEMTNSSRDEIETPPTKVHAFTADGISKTWQYAPNLSGEFDCEPKDIGLILQDDNTIEPWYTC